jgi:GTP:adenosylcobinamide-phosphate guanylyltransferase
MDALILAGGQAPPEMLATLPESDRHEDRALVALNGRPMMDFTLEALRACSHVERIAVVGTPQVLAHIAQNHPQVLGVEAGPRMIENALRGTRFLREQAGASPVALITTSDVPLVSPSTYEEFLRGFEQKGLEASYAIVKREVCEAQFPGGKRTYAKLKDGTYTAGNAVIVRGAVIEKMGAMFERFYDARKNPIAMAKIFGPSFLMRAVTKQLTVKQLEERLTIIAEGKFGAVDMKDASLAFDVDKIEDYRIARSMLEQK